MGGIGLGAFQHLSRQTFIVLTSSALLATTINHQLVLKFLTERLGPHVLAMFFLVFPSLLAKPRLSLAIITSATKPQVGLQDLGPSRCDICWLDGLGFCIIFIFPQMRETTRVENKQVVAHSKIVQQAATLQLSSVSKWD